MIAASLPLTPLLESHRLAAVSSKDNLITLNDGSKWHVTPSQMKELRAWSDSDPLIITPSFRSKSRASNYLIKNRRTHNHIQVQLESGPNDKFSDAQHVVDINFLDQTLVLEDTKEHHTSWQINSADYPFFSSWLRGHHIIIGVNDEESNLVTRFNRILINADLKHHVRAVQQI